MEKKAAVITWCNNGGVTNYGQILQCYAVQRILEGQGYEVIVVLYQKEEYLVIEKTERGKRFNRFIERHIHCSAPCYTKAGVEKLTKDVELLVCGSDQIWNPDCFDPIYFLDFGREDQKRISFAASGIFEDKPEYRELYRQMAGLIERFETVTVREQIAVDILRKYTNREITVQFDPTMLLKKEDWDEVGCGRLNEGDYIFCYILGKLCSHQLVIREVAKKYGVNKILFIPSNIVKEGVLPVFVPIDNVGPAEFISLIKHARAVCTDSFHGVTLSMVYNVPFYALHRRTDMENPYFAAARIRELLERYGMENRMVECARDVESI